jgi:hypothetical protein
MLRRKERRDVRRIVVTVDQTVLTEAKEAMRVEGHSLSILFDVFLRGYRDRNPSVLALIDQIRREQGREPRPVAQATFSRRETDEIFELIEEEKP